MYKAFEKHVDSRHVDTAGLLAGVEVPDRRPVPAVASVGEIERLVARTQHFDPLVRARAHTALHALEARERRRQEQAAVRAGNEETVALARARNEAVVEPGGQGPIKIASRDVLGFMFARGFLTGTQHRAGRAYQRLFERCDYERALAPPPLMRVSGGGGGQSDGAAEQLAIAGDELARTRKRLAAEGREVLLAVDWVAGASRPISAMARGGARREVYGCALKRGLDVLAVLWRVG